MHSVTGLRVVSQFFLLREALHGVKLSSTLPNGLQKLATPLHSVSLLQQLFRNFTAVLTRAHAHSCRFSFRGALGTRTSLSKMAAQLSCRKSDCSSDFSDIIKGRNVLQDDDEVSKTVEEEKDVIGDGE